MNLVRLYVEGITSSQSQKDAYVLLLSVSGSEVKLPIVIGPFEAQAIALEIEKKTIPPRPLTHDLFKNFADIFQVKIQQVVIHKMVDSIFYANMICEHRGETYHLDARTSDAIALALRFQAPIFTYKSILDRAGIQLSIYRNEPDEDTIKPSLDAISTEPHVNNRFAKYPLEKLNTMLGECIENEDYEMAAKIRDEISKRNPSI
ncbi:MAG: bifunctional nuclease family protein [Capnocytophaga sp.]|nr:bifunctional nuclease family protein [Capnocytophaga sp.]